MTMGWPWQPSRNVIPSEGALRPSRKISADEISLISTTGEVPGRQTAGTNEHVGRREARQQRTLAFRCNWLLSGGWRFLIASRSAE
jgi:hypothetical protein